MIWKVCSHNHQKGLVPSCMRRLTGKRAPKWPLRLVHGWLWVGSVTTEEPQKSEEKQAIDELCL